MKPVKRIEIVTVSVEKDSLLSKLQKAGVSGYTMIKRVEGFGDRGKREADELTDVFTNVYVLIMCEEEEVERITEVVRPILRKFGGVCLISDAMSLKS